METKEQLMGHVCSKFISKYGNKPEFIGSVPGRINIIGEHTDYNDGLAMPAAIDRWICVAASRSDGDHSSIYSLNYNTNITLSQNENVDIKEVWMKLAKTSLDVLRLEFSIHHEIIIAVGGNIPIGCGLSSSSAFVISLAYAFCSLFSINVKGKTLAKLCHKIENSALGTAGGLLDQYGIILSKINHCMVIDFHDDTIEYVPILSNEYSWVVVNSCIQRELSESAYFERVNECRQGFKFLKNKFNIKSIRDIDNSMLKALRPGNKNLHDRLTHVMEENIRVNEMRYVLEKGDAIQVGLILRQSHESLKSLYEISCEKIDYIIKSSKSFSGWHGGRIIGGGFGGCSLHLLDTNEVNNYKNFIIERYKIQFGITPDIFKVNIVEGLQSSI